MGHRNTCERGSGDCARDTGHNVAPDAGCREGERFLPASPQDKRIAPLETDNAAAAPGSTNHQRVDVVLAQRMATGTLAHKKALRVPRVPQDALIDERVV